MAHNPSTIETHQTETRAVRLCPGCELAVDIDSLASNQSAYCPRCGTQLYSGFGHSISGNLAIALTCLILFFPALYFPFLSIRLFGEMIPATILDGIILLSHEGFLFLTVLVAYCSIIAPFVACICVLFADLGLKKKRFRLFKQSLKLIQKIKHWMMLDVYILSIAISCFKLQDYSDLHFGYGLYALVCLQILSIILISRLNPQLYWDSWQPEDSYQQAKKEINCHNCNLSQQHGSQCHRCHDKLVHRDPRSIQKTWAYLIVALIAIFPANLIPISILYTGGERLEDTILSGIVSLINEDMQGIAFIIFIASIIVPVVKILGIGYILLSIQFGRSVYHKQRMYIYYGIKWIGKWSMMDLFVISIMISLVDRGQILNFTPGFGAVAFGVVVIFTMLAADSLDPRLIWRNHPATPKANAND